MKHLFYVMIGKYRCLKNMSYHVRIYRMSSRRVLLWQNKVCMVSGSIFWFICYSLGWIMFFIFCWSHYTLELITSTWSWLESHLGGMDSYLMGPTNRYSNRKHCSSRGAGIATVHSAHLPQQNCTRGVHNQSGPNYIIAGPYDWPYMINQSFHFSFLVNATPWHQS